MKLTSALAIYFLFFVATAFLTLSFGVKTADEAGTQKVAGQADSAPHRFDLPRHLLRAGLIALVLTGLYILNYTQGWIGVDALDFYD